MKNVITLFLSIFLISAASFGQTQETGMKFKEETHNFGKIPQGIPVNTVFTFTNYSKEPIVLTNVKASCGCTTPEWTKTPVMPGQKGTITVQYNAASMGAFRKSMTVNYKVGDGEDHTINLFIEGEVIPKSDVEGAPADNIMK